MGILDKLKAIVGLSPESASSDAVEPVVETKPVFDIPAELPRIAVTDAKGMDAFFPEGSARDTTEMPATASEQLDLLLNQEGKPIESIRYLSQNMEQKTAMEWAAQSVEVVEASLPQAEKDALAAGKAAMAEPSPENIALAESSAKAPEMMGPGAWMAMASSAQEGAAKVNTGDLFAQAIAGAVMLAASLTLPDTELPEKPEIAEMPKPPEIPELDMMEMPSFKPPEIPLVEAPVLSVEEQNEAMTACKPFIDIALQLSAQPA